MLASGKGAVVNVTSTVQSIPLPMLGYYGSSKSALAQLTRSLRLELIDTPIRVVEVVPGATDTPLRDIEELPWKTSPPKTLPPVSPQSSATAIVRGLKRGANRVVYPRYSLVPLEIPALGRLVAHIGGRRVDTRIAVDLKVETRAARFAPTGANNWSTPPVRSSPRGLTTRSPPPRSRRTRVSPTA